MKKRILCTAVALILCAVFSINVCAAEPYHTVPKSEWDPVHLAADKYLNENYNCTGYWYSKYKFELDGYSFCYCASSSNTMCPMYDFGEYYLYADMAAPDNVCPIYAVKDGVAYNLQDVYDQQLLDFEEVVKLLGGHFFGDANGDWKLDITDVTEIQHHLANCYYGNCTGIGSPEYDYDRDNRVTIKDATAIQKYLAEFE